MLNETRWLTVGKVKDAHGIRGEFYILLFSGECSWLDHLKSCRVCLESSPEYQEWTVKKAKRFKQGFIAKFDQVLDRTEAEKFKNFLFQIPEALLVSKPGETIFLREILGFAMQTTQGQRGTIVGFSSNGSQDLMVVEMQTASGLAQYEVPLVEDFIVDLNFAKRTLLLNLPLGLLGEIGDQLDDGEDDSSE